MANRARNRSNGSILANGERGAGGWAGLQEASFLYSRLFVASVACRVLGLGSFFKMAAVEADADWSNGGRRVVTETI